MSTRKVVRRMLWFTVAAIFAGGMFVAYWMMRNPVLHDPDARQYALWREGLNPTFPKQRINSFLNEDTDRDSLVRGLTLSQVQEKLYDVRSKDKWTPYQQWCLKNYPQPGDDQSVFLGDDWWGVRFKDGRATGFFLIKGC